MLKPSDMKTPGIGTRSAQIAGNSGGVRPIGCRFQGLGYRVRLAMVSLRVLEGVMTAVAMVSSGL